MEPTGALTFFQDAQRRTGWQHTLASPEETARIIARVEQGLQEGALGIGVLAGYAPGYGRKEAFAVAQLAARVGVPTFTHVRYNSVDRAAVVIRGDRRGRVARRRQPAPTCTSTTSTAPACATFRASPSCCAAHRGAACGSRPRRILTARDPQSSERRSSAATGANVSVAPRPAISSSPASHSLTPRSPRRRRKHRARGLSPTSCVPIAMPRIRSYLDQSVLFPGGAIASDAMPWTSKGQPVTGDVWPLPDDAFAHPRSAGTYTRFLRDYVRERRKVTLREGLRRMTLIPAQILEAERAADEAERTCAGGRGRRLVAFDLATVSDRATYTQPNQTAVGMRYVIVNGTAVIRDGELVRDALPGRAIRRPVTTR